jgi:hypothetical protein
MWFIPWAQTKDNSEVLGVRRKKFVLCLQQRKLQIATQNVTFCDLLKLYIHITVERKIKPLL